MMLTPGAIAAIEFGSPAMLGWLAAAALPWLINLWMRRRHVETPWAAVELLLAAVRERSRRLRLREWLLLVLRTAILALAALAAARPLWRETSAIDAGVGRTHHVIVVDQSASMATRAGGRSRLERARERARSIVEESPAGDAYTVIGWSHRTDSVLGKPMSEAARALAAIDGLAQQDGVADLAAALRSVAAAVDAGRAALPSIRRTRVALVSDLAEVTWSPALPAATNGGQPPQALTQTRALWDELHARAEIVAESVDDDVRDNLAIAALELSPAMPTLATAATVTVRLEAFGRRAWSGVAVELLLDGTRVGQQSAEVTPGQPAAVRFDVQLTGTGHHLFEARANAAEVAGARPQGADALAVDDRRWLAVDVREAPRVLCIVDAPGAADDIARALNPRRGLSTAGGGIAVEIASAASLTATDLSAYDAVFAANVAEFSPREATLLQRYVADGGAVVFVLGDRIRPESYNRLFAAEAKNANVAPTVAADGPLVALTVAAAPVEGDWRLEPLEYRHPILASFAGRNRAGLLGVRVSRYFPLDLDAAAGQAATALAFTTGDPALVVGGFGLGRVAVLATDPALAAGGKSWTTLALSPAFLPLARELFDYIAAERRSARLNRLVGEPLAAPVQFAPAGAKTFMWETPDGQEVETLSDTERRGAYTLRIADNQGDHNGDQLIFAVNVDPRESDLAAIDPGKLRGGVVAAPLAMGGGVLPYVGAVPLERLLLAAVAALVLLELATAWALGRSWA